MARARSLKKILELLHQQIPMLAERYGIEKLEVFGSYVRDEQRKDSCGPTVHRRVDGILKVPTVHRRDGRVWQPPLLDTPMTVTSSRANTGTA